MLHNGPPPSVLPVLGPQETPEFQTTMGDIDPLNGIVSLDVIAGKGEAEDFRPGVEVAPSFEDPVKLGQELKGKHLGLGAQVNDRFSVCIPHRHTGKH